MFFNFKILRKTATFPPPELHRCLHAEVWTFDGFKALFMPRTDPMPEEASSGLGYHVEKLRLQNEILALGYPDCRFTGHSMGRFNDDLRMEFTQLEGEADVHFTHARGFIAKTSSAEIERLKELVSLAYKKA